MNEHQIDALQIILNNPVVLGALRQVFSETLSSSLPGVVNEANEVIGEKYRAYHDATNIVWTAFRKLESYKKPEKVELLDDRHI